MQMKSNAFFKYKIDECGASLVEGMRVPDPLSLAISLSHHDLIAPTWRPKVLPITVWKPQIYLILSTTLQCYWVIHCTKFIHLTYSY